MSPETEADSTVRCVVCKSQIHASAKLCPVCKSFQSPARRRIQFFVGIPVVLAVVVPFAFNQLMELYEWATSDSSVEIVRYHYPGEIVILNNGNGGVFVSEIMMNFPAMRNKDYVISTSLIVDEGKIGIWKIGESQPERWNAIEDKGIIERQQLEAIIASEILPEECVRADFYMVEDPALRMYKERTGNTAFTLPATAEVRYFGIESTESKEVFFDLEAIILFNYSCEYLPESMRRK